MASLKSGQQFESFPAHPSLSFEGGERERTGRNGGVPFGDLAICTACVRLVSCTGVVFPSCHVLEGRESEFQEREKFGLRQFLIPLFPPGGYQFNTRQFERKTIKHDSTRVLRAGDERGSTSSTITTVNENVVDAADNSQPGYPGREDSQCAQTQSHTAKTRSIISALSEVVFHAIRSKHTKQQCLAPVQRPRDVCMYACMHARHNVDGGDRQRARVVPPSSPERLPTWLRAARR